MNLLFPAKSGRHLEFKNFSALHFIPFCSSCHTETSYQIWWSYHENEHFFAKLHHYLEFTKMHHFQIQNQIPQRLNIPYILCIRPANSGLIDAHAAAKLSLKINHILYNLLSSGHWKVILPCIKTSQLLGDFVPQTPYRGFAPGPHWGTSVPQTPLPLPGKISVEAHYDPLFYFSTIRALVIINTET